MSARDDHNSPMDLSLKIILVCLGFKRTFSFKMRRSAAPAPCRAVSWIVLDWRGWFRRLVAAGCWTRSSRAIDWRLRLEGSLKLLPNEMAESLFSRLFCRRFAGTKKVAETDDHVERNWVNFWTLKLGFTSQPDWFTFCSTSLDRKLSSSCLQWV